MELRLLINFGFQGGEGVVTSFDEFSRAALHSVLPLPSSGSDIVGEVRKGVVVHPDRPLGEIGGVVGMGPSIFRVGLFERTTVPKFSLLQVIARCSA